MAAKVQNLTINEFRPEDMEMSCTWIVIAPPATGKCFARDTPILMYDGSTKMVQDVRDHDMVMGDDSRPRRVIGCTQGRDPLYRIVPVFADRGDPYTVNGSHILCLKHGDEVVEISVDQFLKLANPEQYHGYRAAKAGEDPPPTTPITIEPIGEGDYFGFRVDQNGRFLLGDFTVTHNSSFIENMVYHRKHLYPVAKVFQGIESAYVRACRIFGPLFVSNTWSEKEEEDHVKRQRTCVLQNGAGYPGNYAINIIDDAIEDPREYKKPLFLKLFKYGSQHYAQMLMIGTQYALDFPPAIRNSVSYVAIGRNDSEAERKKLYENFGGICGSYETFCKLMDALTGDYTFMIINRRTQSNKLEDCVFWYRTKVLGNWKFGSAESRKWNADRYDTGYVESIDA